MGSKQNKSIKVTKDSLVADVVKSFPNAISTMRDHGVQFIGSHIACNKTLEQAAIKDRISVFGLLEDINNEIRHELYKKN